MGQFVLMLCHSLSPGSILPGHEIQGLFHCGLKTETPPPFFCSDTPGSDTVRKWRASTAGSVFALHIADWV